MVVEEWEKEEERRRREGLRGTGVGLNGPGLQRWAVGHANK